MKRPLTLDTLAIGLALVLAAAIGLVILLGGQMGVRAAADLPEGRLVGPYQVITLTFSEPVDPELTAALWTLQPQVDGLIDWPNPRTLRFTPSRPFSLDTDYELTLRPGAVTPGGREIERAQTWTVRVREPLAVVLRSVNGDSGLWAVDLDGNTSHRLTSESVKVISYDAARSGDYLVYCSANEQGGIDLWRVSRAGGDDALLLDCGRDRCTAPAISPDGARVAYSREAAGPGPDLPYGSPRIWMLDIANGQNGPVYADQQVIGYGPSWSPDGARLASFDGLSDQLRILDLTNSEQFIFSSETGDTVTWSPDGAFFLFTDMLQDENGLRTQVRRADLTLNKTDVLIGLNDRRDYSYGSLAWSPLGDRVVLGLRVADDKPGESLWLFDPVVLEGPMIANADGVTYNAPVWNPWGTALLFQQFKLRGEYVPEVSLWSVGDVEPRLLTEGLMPRWLP
ncbi:MAG: PD40 domain-containing protein [Chloroflexi bacterium]|nr:PD40 domain-containing protein [Chloroflexota bacterium]